MKIINLQSNSNGSYSLQEYRDTIPPNGCAIIPDTLDIEIFYNMKGFVNIIVENGFVVSMTGNQNAYDINFPQPTIDEIHKNVLNRINGKCSTTIYSGVTINNKHYKLTPTAQSNLKTALDKIASGATSVIYSADNEEPTLHTAAQITAINNAAYEWGIVNTTYYGKLQKWIARETNVDILNTIDYGIQLPDDLMQELGILLNNVGIDISKYANKILTN